jgi:ribosome-binding factor A
MERLGSLLQQELAIIIQRELTDPRITGFPSVTRVKVADDLSVADVYLTVMGTPGQQSAALNAIRHAGGMMRTLLHKSLTIRQVPFLKFHIDEQLKKELEEERKQAEKDAAIAARREAAARAEEERDAAIAAAKAAGQPGDGTGPATDGAAGSGPENESDKGKQE